MAFRWLWPPILLLFLASLFQSALSLPTLNPTHLHHELLLSPQSLEARADFSHPPALEETIEEVQKILARDPTLPRLTRGEIQELYEKVTREEFEKSISAGDLGRADSMRALMLVLPYNTDNNTEENLQELYTRPPVTKVIETYTPPQPIKFITADPSATPKLQQQSADGSQLAATTYKPAYSLKIRPPPAPTTYHPPPPAPLLYKMQPSMSYPLAVESPAASVSAPFQPVTLAPMIFDYGTAAQMDISDTSKTPSQQRFSSHYNAKHANFLKKKPLQSSTSFTSTVMPVADVLESLGIVGQQQRQRHRFSSVSAEDFFAVEESAPQPVISTFVPPPQQSYTPQITPEAYSSFKPLNIGEEIRVKPEVEGYLTRFGIVGGRKRKAMKKDSKNGATDGEQVGAQTEIATSRVPGASPTPSELEKLLENLQELERLNVRPKQQQNKSITTTTTTTTSTTTTTTPSPTTTTNLITNGIPMLIEPKKPRRRIDPQLDLNFGAAGNHHSDSPNTSNGGGSDRQLAKLLENLQELEKLRITPANALKPVINPVPTTPQPSIPTTTTLPTTTTTATPIRPQAIINRFSEFNYLPAAQTPKGATTSAVVQQSQPDLQQLQRVLKQLQVFEQANSRTSIPTFAPIRTTTTAVTTKAPQRRPPTTTSNQLNFGLTDFSQLRKLLTDDRELERLYEQARARQTPTTPKTTTARTTSTAKSPLPTLDDLQQLQQYLAAFDTRSTTIAPSTTSTTTTYAPASPTLSSNSLAQRIALANLERQTTVPKSVGNADLLALINRVQELERLSNGVQISTTTTTTTKRPPTTSTTSTSTTTTTSAPVPGMPFFGFTSRNVKANANDLRVPSNDFAQLQQLYQQVNGETVDNGPVEISTAATTGIKANRPAVVSKQKLIDFNNDTGGGFNDIAGLQAVDANDFVQLQKLLSKVQELERVKITNDKNVNERRPPPTPQLVTAASVPAGAAIQLNGVKPDSKSPYIIYPEKESKATNTTFNRIGESFLKSEVDNGGDFGDFDDLKLELPAYELTTPRTNTHVKKDGATLSLPPEPNSSEELRDLAHPTSSKAGSATSGSDSLALQQLFSRLTDNAERNAYKNLQPPIIMKTMPPPASPSPSVVVTKEPPRFIATRRPQDVNVPPMKKSQEDLTELQKLLSNAQELEKLGVTLPQELSHQIEQKLILPNDKHVPDYKRISSTTLAPAVVTSNIIDHTSRLADTTITSDVPEEKTVVFSVTTMKSPPSLKRPLAVPPTAPSETALELPVVSYNKVIEAAVRQAASRFGFTTEQPQGFRRRSDLSVEEGDAIISDRIDDLVNDDGDLMGDFSEVVNYQVLVPPEINSMATIATDVVDETTNSTTSFASMTPDLTSHDMGELQRLIGNLQELQRLNISLSSDLLRQADQRYLQSVQNLPKATNGGDGGDPEAAEIKTRRQSVIEGTVATDATTTIAPGVMIVTPIAAIESSTTPTTTTTEPDTTIASSMPTRLSLDLGTLSSDSETVETLSSNSATTEASTTSTTTEEEPRNGSLADLEASFGPDPIETASPPPKKKNGFYFLADWNSFLEVGDGDDQVVVRFSPKIGDPRLFLPVKVP